MRGTGVRWDVCWGGLPSGDGRAEKGWLLVWSVYCELRIPERLPRSICPREGRGCRGPILQTG